MRALVLLLLLVGCGRTELNRPPPDIQSVIPPPDVQPVDAGVRDAGAVDAGERDAGPPPWVCSSGDAPEPGPEACERDVVAGLIRPSDPGCFDDPVPKSGEHGTLRWDCTGNSGAAEIIFQRATFHGYFDAPDVTVCVGTTYDGPDGCGWASAQRIEGSILDGGTLTFAYAEGITDDRGGCWHPCTEHGPIQIENGPL